MGSNEHTRLQFHCPSSATQNPGPPACCYRKILICSLSFLQWRKSSRVWNVARSRECNDKPWNLVFSVGVLCQWSVWVGQRRDLRRIFPHGRCVSKTKQAWRHTLALHRGRHTYISVSTSLWNAAHWVVCVQVACFWHTHLCKLMEGISQCGTQAEDCFGKWIRDSKPSCLCYTFTAYQYKHPKINFHHLLTLRSV